ncbi:MAG TPA: hypothetical protein VGN26_03965 [Armatimonadota bacterium]|jgi:hypothetical protein
MALTPWEAKDRERRSWEEYVAGAEECVDKRLASGSREIECEFPDGRCFGPALISDLTSRYSEHGWEVFCQNPTTWGQPCKLHFTALQDAGPEPGSKPTLRQTIQGLLRSFFAASDCR